jgi:drug/metabolite transporter (DMT)-like permease
MKRPVDLPVTMRGVLWMLLQAATITAMIASVRYVSTTIPPHEIAFFRGAFGLVFLLPWLVRTGRAAFTPALPGIVLLRGVFAVAGMMFWFVALAAMPISDAVAVAFTAPIFVIIGAGLLLRETVGARRAIVAVVGFCGAVIIIRPGAGMMNPMVVFVLLAALSNASVQLTTRRLAGAATGGQVTLYMNLMLMPVALVFAVPGWVTPELADLPWLCAVGVFGTAAHIFLSRAMSATDASVISPIDFARLPFAALYGWLLFGETSDFWTWVGAAVIFAAITYMTRYESGRRGNP